MSNIPFFELQPGSNRIRIISAPYQYLTHSELKLEGVQHFKQKIKCAYDIGDDGHRIDNCPLCENFYEKIKPRWILAIISDLDLGGKLYYLDIKSDLFKSMQYFAQDCYWGSKFDYDLNIIIDDHSYNNQSDYSRKNYIIPYPKIELSLQHQIIKDNLDLSELKKLVAPANKDYFENIKYTEI